LPTFWRPLSGVERVAEYAYFLARRRRDNTRFDRRGQRLYPGGADLVERAAEAKAIDFRIGSEPGDEDGDIVTGGFAIGGLREQECSPVGLGDTAAILPTHQRMHLGIFVDRLIDDDQQPGAVQGQHMIVQIGIAALAAVFAAVAFEHTRNFVGSAHRDFHSMIRKGGYRLSEKIMLKQQAKAKW
jgi:hypothetical protein